MSAAQRRPGERSSVMQRQMRACCKQRLNNHSADSSKETLFYFQVLLMEILMTKTSPSTVLALAQLISK